MRTISISNTLQVGVSIDSENVLWLSFLTVSHFLWRSPFSGHRFSTTLPFLCPKAINRKQNFVKWSQKIYLLPYQSSLSWVTLTRTRARWHWSLYLVVLMQWQYLRYTARLDFSEVCHLVLNPLLLVSAGKLKLYGVKVCSGWGWSHGEMYCIVIRGSVPPSRANKYQNE